jgi:hypothetical protein
VNQHFDYNEYCWELLSISESLNNTLMRDPLTTMQLFEQLKQIANVGTPLERWLPALLATLDEEDSAEHYALLRVGHVLSWGSAMYAIRHISQAPNAATPVALTLYCLLRFGDDEGRMIEVANSCGELVDRFVREMRVER